MFSCRVNKPVRALALMMDVSMFCLWLGVCVHVYNMSVCVCVWMGLKVGYLPVVHFWGRTLARGRCMCKHLCARNRCFMVEHVIVKFGNPVDHNTLRS